MEAWVGDRPGFPCFPNVPHPPIAMRLPLPQFRGDHHDPDHLAEVIETRTTEFLAQCLEPEDLSFPKMPPFGSWVKSFDEESGNTVYGVVTYVTTTPIDSVHRARALGLSLADLREQQPQIFAMLKTEFKAAIVGYGLESDRPQDFFQYLPPRPPQIHQAVYRCTPEEIIGFSEKLDFIRTLLQVQDVPVESLIAASIREIFTLRQQYQSSPAFLAHPPGDRPRESRPWLVQVGRTISTLLKDDYDRLRYILSQIHFVG